MKRGIYLVTEKGCMNPTTGAYQHISIGKKMLSRYFAMEYCMLFDEFTPIQENIPTRINGKRKKNRFSLKRSPFIGGVRDVCIFIKQNIGIVKAYKKIKRCQPDFIYERTSFLDFRGLIVARLLRIPHFYENNGIAAFYHHKHYYPSIFHKVCLWIEALAYKNSNYTFYVGTWGNFFNSKKNNWRNVENGIERSLLLQNNDFQREVGERITIGFIGRLMNHHNIELLIDALRLLQHPSKIKLLLMGHGFQEVVQKASSFVVCESVGYIPRDQIASYLRKIDVGLIPGAEEYLSQMKLYDYAASKALVICPDTLNLKYWFTDNEVLFFDKNSAEDLAAKIDRVATTPWLIDQMGNALFNKVCAKFTWDHIFDQKADIIKNILKEKVA